MKSGAQMPVIYLHVHACMDKYVSTHVKCALVYEIFI